MIQQGHNANEGAVSGLSMRASLTHARTETRVQPEGQVENHQIILISWNFIIVDLTFDLLKHWFNFKVDFFFLNTSFVKHNIPCIITKKKNVFNIASGVYLRCRLERNAYLLCSMKPDIL